jgi:hypothetical protein
MNSWNEIEWNKNAFSMMATATATMMMMEKMQILQSM